MTWARPKPNSKTTLLVLVAFQANCAPAFAAAPTEWLLEQRHHLSGVHVFKFTPTGIEVTCKQIGWQMVSKAPDWGVCAFRLDDKVKCTMDRQAFYNNRGFKVKTHRMKHYTPIGTRTVGLIKAQVFSSSYQEVWVGKLPQIPSEVEDMIVAYLQSTAVDGFLLRRTLNAVDGPVRQDTSIFSDNHHGPLVAVETLTLKKIPYNPQDFAVPGGLKEVKGMEFVTTSRSSRRAAEAVIEEMGVGEALGSPTKK